MNMTSAFALYGAKIKNPRWAVSALATDGALVLSCWAHYFKTAQPGTMRYSDRLSRWSEANAVGSDLCREHLEKAQAESLPIRLVIATTKDEATVDGGTGATVKADFTARRTHIGHVVEFDGDELVVDFVRPTE